MKPKVSIIIPVYNGEKHMREAIDSALNQTYDNCEVLVVNDGSTDNTEEIALSYGEKIRYFSKENGGVSTALNMGIENMTGEYFCYLPHDDRYHLNKIEKQIEVIVDSDDKKTIVWSAQNFNYDETGEIKRAYPLIMYDNIELFQNGVAALLLNVVNTITVMLHKSYFEEYGLFNPNLPTTQDYDMWFRVFRGRKTIYIEEPLADYRLHVEQGSQAYTGFKKECLSTFLMMFNALSEDEIIELFGSRERLCYLLKEFYILNWKDSKDSCWLDGIEIMEKNLKQLSLNQRLSDSKEEIWKLLRMYTDGKEKKIVLYCAGGNAKRIVDILQERGVEIDKLIDSNKEKLGMEYNGVQCRNIKESDKEDSLIIVTKDAPDELVLELRKQGYQYVIPHTEVIHKIYWILPEKTV